MSYNDLEDKFDQDFVYILYNVEKEGPAVQPESDKDVQSILPTEEPYKTIALSVLHGDVEASLSNVNDALDKGAEPLSLINDGLMKGMDAVSVLYTKGLYFLPDLMLSGDSMMESVKECEKKLGHQSETKANVVSFVSEGDPHDIGKNLVVMFLRANGYNAIDMGRDVPTPDVIKAVEEYKPIFVTGTALMTTTMTVFAKVAEELQKKGLEVPAIGFGGGAVRKDYIETIPMGIYGVEAYHTPKLADSILNDKKDWKAIRKEYSDIVGEFVPEYS